jgi:subtilisin family serine protease
MCEFLPGRVLLSHVSDDESAQQVVMLIRDGVVGDIQYVASMDELVHRDHYKYPLHLLQTPIGQEMAGVNLLQGIYQQQFVERLRSQAISFDRTPRQINIFGSPNLKMIAAPEAAIGLSSFQFDAVHQTYKTSLGISGTETGKGVTVAVIDTGLDPALGIVPHASSRSFHDKTTTTDVDDVNGHGTAVASIIHDLAPGADLKIMKVGDKDPLGEWNLLNALYEAADADVVNISLAYGPHHLDCSKCGRSQTHSSISASFARAIEEILGINNNLIIVAAAGNRREKTVDYPARFGELVAVGAVDSAGTVASYSNTGATDHDGNAHDYLFFAPGGGNGEFVGTSTRGGKSVDYEGTSFAAPYVSALVALYYESQGGNRPSRRATLAHCQQRASQNMTGYTSTEHGNGIIRALV